MGMKLSRVFISWFFSWFFCMIISRCSRGSIGNSAHDILMNSLVTLEMFLLQTLMFISAKILKAISVLLKKNLMFGSSPST